MFKVIKQYFCNHTYKLVSTQKTGNVYYISQARAFDKLLEFKTPIKVEEVVAYKQCIVCNHEKQSLILGEKTNG